jgi:hypothetical protein
MCARGPHLRGVALSLCLRQLRVQGAQLRRGAGDLAAGRAGGAKRLLARVAVAGVRFGC